MTGSVFSRLQDSNGRWTRSTTRPINRRRRIPLGHVRDPFCHLPEHAGLTRSGRLVGGGRGEVQPREREGFREICFTLLTTVGTARVHFGGGARAVAVYRREDLPTSARLRVPCVVTEYSSTTLVPEGVRAGIDGRGNLVVEL